ncbi:hypothetical protein [Bosea sp. RAC05]|uniref:hypothetical protein n=1 Tax=Bosea sp. RAC05 TaxID=1842539 RepID=UPI001AED065D|nr:hypothetical protein [Bosea sp. RAC05]
MMGTMIGARAAIREVASSAQTIIDQMGDEISRKDGVIARQKSEISAKDDLIARQKAAISNRDGVIARKSAEVASKDAEISHLRTALILAQASSAGLKASIFRLQDELVEKSPTTGVMEPKDRPLDYTTIVAKVAEACGKAFDEHARAHGLMNPEAYRGRA